MCPVDSPRADERLSLLGVVEVAPPPPPERLRLAQSLKTNTIESKVVGVHFGPPALFLSTLFGCEDGPGTQPVERCAPRG